MRHDVAFPSDGDTCKAWLFMPDTEQPPPLVIMGHGLGGTREMGLEPYAKKFAAAGMAALIFTYRHFGDSGGTPRRLVDIDHQLGDWAAALAYARNLKEIDTTRIAVWGSSFGGGHVIEVAARDGGVAAVVSQCPFTDGIASLRCFSLRSLVRLAVAALRDDVARIFGMPPVMIPFVGPPGSTAVLSSPDSETGYRALVPPELLSEDTTPARFVNRVTFYRPGRSARKVKAPMLFCLCDGDAVAPADVAARYAATAPRAEVKRYPIGHFDIYLGEPFKRAVLDQTEFLVRHLGVA